MDEEYSSLYKDLLSRLESLARRLIDETDPTPPGVWQIEKDLIAFQVEMQNAIVKERENWRVLKKAKEEALALRAEGWKEQVSDLDKQAAAKSGIIDLYNYAWKLSRKIGDTIAWVLFGMDEMAISTLAMNSRSDVIPTGDALAGMLAACEALAQKGWGFPIVHDMTDALRVGDATFVFRAENAEPITVEVKTHGVERTETENEIVNKYSLDVITVLPKEAAANLDIETMSFSRPNASTGPETRTEPTQRLVRAGPQSPDNGKPERTRPRFRGRGRLHRQYERMKHAIAARESSAGQIIDMPDLAPRDREGNVLNSEQRKMAVVKAFHSGSSHHWDVLKEVLTEARASGYASRAVDGAIMYAAMYWNPDGAGLGLLDPGFLDQYKEFSTRASTELIESGILHSEPDENFLRLQSSWFASANRSPFVLRPFFLYPIPGDLAIDMMWGRLGINVYVNWRRVVEALQEAGIDAQIPENTQEKQGRLLRIVGTADVDGRTVQFMLGGLEVHTLAAKLEQEFYSLSGFVDVVRQTIEATAKVTVEIFARNEHTGELLTGDNTQA